MTATLPTARVQINLRASRPVFIGRNSPRAFCLLTRTTPRDYCVAGSIKNHRPGGTGKTIGDTMIATNTYTNARLYVGTYAKYNAGSLAGAWLDLGEFPDRDSFLDACAELHKDENDPELMFQAFDGFPRAWYCESSAPADILWEWLELGDDEREAFGLYADHMGGDVTVDDFRDAYQGTADSPADFAERTAEGCGDIPKDLPAWIVIDWEASWNCNLRHDYFTERGESGQLHFFRSI